MGLKKDKYDSKDTSLKQLLIILAVILLVLGIISIVKKSKNNDTNTETEIKLETVKDYSTFFTVENCINKYINALSNSNGEDAFNLLTNEYKGDITKLELICPNGHEWSITWKNFKKGSRCPFCTGKKSTHKRTHKEAKKEIEKEGYKLLSEYKNANSKILIQCPHGHTYEVEFNSFHKGRRCKLCTNKNIKFTYEEVKEYIESQGDKLLSKEYKDNKK